MLDHAEQEVLRLRMLKGKDALPHVIEKEGGEYEIPGMEDRFLAQVAHVGVQGLPARGAENDLGQDEESRQPVFPQELEGVLGADGLEDPRHGGDGRKPRNRQREEPDQHDRAEDPGDPVRSPGLKGKKPHGNHGRDQNQDLRPKVFKSRDEQHPLDGGQEGDGGRNDAVAQQQRDADEGEKAGEGELAGRV